MGRLALVASLMFPSLAACGPGIEGELAVVGGQGPCLDRAGQPLAVMTIEAHANGDVVESDSARCGERFYIPTGAGEYRIEAWLYTVDGSARLGVGAVDAVVVDQTDVDLGTLVVSLD